MSISGLFHITHFNIRFTDDDQLNLVGLINKWQEASPEDNFLFRPALVLQHIDLYLNVTIRHKDANMSLMMCVMLFDFFLQPKYTIGHPSIPNRSSINTQVVIQQ